MMWRALTHSSAGRSVIAIWCLLGTATSLQAETLPIQGVYPAGDDGLSALGSLTIGTFSGRDGQTFSIALEQRLRDVSVRGMRYFDITPSKADGTIRGSASGAFQQQRETRQKEMCVRKNADGKCIEKRLVNENCTRRIITLNYTLSVDGKRRERIFLIDQAPQYSDLVCPDTYGAPTSDAIIRQMIGTVADGLRVQFAPYEQRDDIRVKEGLEGLKGNAKSKFKEAIGLTKRNVASACSVWGEVDRLVPNHAPTLFNLGLCAESRGEYGTAEALYNRVVDINRTERYATDALQRLELHRHAERQLAARFGKGKG